MLRHFGVHPYVVFDGDNLPSKKMTEDDRAKRRETSRKLALDLLASGKTTQALQEAQKCIDITPDMACELISELQRLDVPYVVAPYEADAQLVYLERKGLIGGIMSEDSDLLVFGAKRLLTKLDKYGDLMEINRRDFSACREVMLSGWTDADFRRMAILSGCDYLKGLPQVGLKKAHSLLRKYKTPEKVVRMVMLEGKIRVPENFLRDFVQAERTFLYQRVYCPIKQEVVFLTEPEPGQGIEELDFIGAPVEPELARAIAKGDVNPVTKLPIRPPLKTPESSKRRHSQFAGVHNSTGTGSNSARTSVRPPMRPIESYFGDHRRVAMGEMDPNCFSVDKQRLAALTDNGRISIVFPLPRPYLDEAPAAASRAQRRRHTEPITNLLADLSSPGRSAHVSLSAEVTDFGGSVTWSSSSSSSSLTGRPPKKARLCADDLGDQPQTRSKFFSPKANQLLGTKRRHTDNFLMSDRSLDDVLAELPDVDSWTPIKNHKSVAVFREEEVTIFCEEGGGSDKAVGMLDAAEAEAGVRVETEIDVEVTEINGPVGGEVEMPVSPLVETRIRQTVRQFSYSPAMKSGQSVQSGQSAQARRASSTGLSGISSNSLRSPASTPRAPTPATSVSTKSLTPLQRIGARALGRQSISLTKHLVALDSVVEKSRMRLSLPANPSFVPLPNVDLDEVDALSRPCGSEDLIIPASDDDDDNDDNDDDEGATKETVGFAAGHGTERMLGLGDLGRFAYA